MSAHFKIVTLDQFREFVRTYPRPLTFDRCGISEPALCTYSDFGAAKGSHAVVAKYHEDLHEEHRQYRVSRHLLEPADAMVILLYKPPNGRWYVHSHKIYPSNDAAREAAREFLAPGTQISFRKVEAPWLEKLSEIV